MTGLVDIIGLEALAALDRPTGEAEGLPPAAYTSEEFFRLEREKLFPRTWMAIGFASDVPDSGDAWPLTAAGWPLLILRDRKGAVRVFHNICPHRGMSPVAEPCKGLATIRCPWHSWSFDLDGRLVAQPNIGGVGVNHADGFDRDALGLREVRADVFLDTVFVNIDGKAPPLAAYVAPFLRYFREFDFSLIRRNRDLGYEGTWHVNWKIGIEGGIEDYHLPWVHPELFEQRTDWRGRGVTDGMMVGTEDVIPSEHRSSIVDLEKGALPTFPGLPDDAAWRGNFMMIFPNIGYTVLADHFDAFLMLPETPTRSYMRGALYFVGDEAATAPRYEAARRKVREAWNLIGEQDTPLSECVQGNQFAREAAGIPNRFSPAWENAVHRFQQLVVETIAA
jgi:choline monooxygenase